MSLEKRVITKVPVGKRANATGGPSVLVLRSLGEGGCSANVPVETSATVW